MQLYKPANTCQEWNDFEIASIVCGAIAWVAIIIVLGICGVGNLILKLRSHKKDIITFGFVLLYQQTETDIKQ
ncbi:hypothetical protein MAR_013043 [Mya arenaria]|uniref:Uncharacterized protein n=1 Tax=Mya arenaria TaxID=6604 RepID=A0ABY7G1R7_MYAAR|nr:hypothetical protein MAR_013043 [Mya arenaria]